MFSHKSYLKLGDHSGTDILSLMKSGYEVANYEFSFQQGVDSKGQASTEVFGGSLSLILPSLPKKDIIEWAMLSNKRISGVIVVLNDRDEPLEKVYFKEAYCVNMNISYSRKGKSYTTTSIMLQAGELRFGKDLDFSNHWVE